MKADTLIVLLLLLIPAFASADLAPSVYDGLSIVPAENTEICMRAENVEIFIRNAGKQAPFRYLCDVKAELIGNILNGDRY